MQYAISFLAIIGAVSALPHAPEGYGYEHPPQYNTTISSSSTSTWSATSSSTSITLSQTIPGYPYSSSSSSSSSTWSSTTKVVPPPYTRSSSSSTTSTSCSTSTTKVVPPPSGYPHPGPPAHEPQSYPTGGHHNPPPVYPTGGHAKPPHVYPTGSHNPPVIITKPTTTQTVTGYITTTKTATITKTVPTLVPCSTETSSNGQHWWTTYLSTSYVTITTTSCDTSVYPAPTPYHLGGQPQQPGHPSYPGAPGHDQPYRPGNGKPGQGQPRYPGLPITPGQSYCPAPVTVTHTITAVDSKPTPPAGGACEHCKTETIVITLPHDYTTTMTVTYIAPPHKPTHGGKPNGPYYPIPDTTTVKPLPTGALPTAGHHLPRPSGYQPHPAPQPSGYKPHPHPQPYSSSSSTKSSSSSTSQSNWGAKPTAYGYGDQW